MSNKKANNQKLIEETKQIQEQTKDATSRIKQMAAEANEIGNESLDQLRQQGNQMNEITADVETVSNKLDEAQKLQNTFDVWNGNIFGFSRRKAEKEAAAEILARQKEELMSVKEVFEQQKYNSISSSWKPVNLVLCSDTKIYVTITNDIEQCKIANCIR